ncbi:MAG: interleukin-like EMT inducer domain-containing protein [Algibacter sp.]
MIKFKRNSVNKIVVLVFMIFASLCLSAQTSVYVKGTGLNNNSSRQVKLNGQGIACTNSRGLCLTIINANTHQYISSNAYDTYGSTIASDALADELNNLKSGEIGVLTSYDAWESNVTEHLKDAARRLGLYKLGGGIDYSSRRPYAAIFRGSGSSTNNLQPNHIVYEVMQSNSSGSEYAVIATWLIEDAFIGSNLSNALVSGNGTISGSSVLVDDLGNVGIGTTIPDSKLTVAGNIHAREVKVTIDAGADFVFNDDYKLPPLQEISQFIKEHKHLPEIASEKEMQKNGLHLAEMDIKLLQKIEELTLYTIDQEEKLKIKNIEVEGLNEKLNSQGRRLSEIEELIKNKKDD